MYTSVHRLAGATAIHVRRAGHSRAPSVCGGVHVGGTDPPLLPPFPPPTTINSPGGHASQKRSVSIPGRHARRCALWMVTLSISMILYSLLFEGGWAGGYETDTC
ncbi:unnamed protein product [Parajaminaea phylloscopi]